MNNIFLDNLIFCLNGTIPIFLMMVLGMFLRRIGMMSEEFTNKINSFVFKVSLPLMLFNDMSKTDYSKAWDGGYIAFCFFGTLASIALVAAVSYGLKDRSVQGEFIQTSYRSSAALLGAALVMNMYGNIGAIPLMIIGAVPLYNIAAVVVLSIFNPSEVGKRVDKQRIKRTLIGIVTNPLIITIFISLVWSVVGIKMPTILDSTIASVGKTATPLGLIALGASFDMKKALESAGPSILSTFFKLLGLGLILLPIAAHIGYTDSKLVALIIMCGSPSTVSCYIMAKEMGHEGTLTSSSVMLSTLLSSFTLTLWLFIFKNLGML